MKKFILITLSIIITNSAFSQVFGKYEPSNVKKVDTKKDYKDVTGEWLQMEPGARAFMFKLSAVGIGKAFQLLDEILKVNNLERSNYVEDKSIVQKGIDRWDNEELYLSIYVEKSEINMTWEIPKKTGQNRQILNLTLTKEAYVIVIVNK